MHARIVQEGALAQSGRIHLVMAGITDDADLCLVLMDAGQHHAPGGNGANKIGCSVNRVDHPCIARAACHAGVFLTDDAIIRKGLGQSLANEKLNLDIRIGHKVLRSLLLDLQISDGAKKGKCQFSGITRQRTGQFKPLLQILVQVEDSRCFETIDHCQAQSTSESVLVS